MYVTFNQIEDIFKTLPIGYYLGRNIENKLCRGMNSYFDPVRDTIVIGADLIIESVRNINDNFITLEEMVRGLLYHEISHVLLTPKTLKSNSFTDAENDAINILEDERIETVMSHVYYGVNFKKNVIAFNCCGTPEPTARTFFISIVRLHAGPEKFIKRAEQLISRYKDIAANTPYYEFSSYVADIISFWREVKAYFDANRPKLNNKSKQNKSNDRDNSNNSSDNNSANQSDNNESNSPDSSNQSNDQQSSNDSNSDDKNSDNSTNNDTDENESSDSDKSDKSDKSSKSDNSNDSDNTDESDESDGDESDSSDDTDDSDESDGSSKSDKSDGSDESDDSNDSDGSEDTDESDDTNDTNDTNSDERKNGGQPDDTTNSADDDADSEEKEKMLDAIKGFIEPFEDFEDNGDSSATCGAVMDAIEDAENDINTTSIEDLIEKITDVMNDLSNPMTDAIAKALANKAIESVINEYYDSAMFEKISDMISKKLKLNKHNGSAINSYSGRLNPRLVARNDDYKWWAQQNRQGHIRMYSAVHFTLFIDNSSSFSRNDVKMNTFIQCLDKYKDPNFSFDIVTMNTQICEWPDHHRKFSSCGGTSLSPAIEEVIKRHHKPCTNNYDIVLFDGDAHTSDHYSSRSDHSDDPFGLFDSPNTIIITDGSNRKYISASVHTARVKYTSNYCDEFINAIFELLDRVI